VLFSVVFRIAVPVLTHEFFSAETVMEVIFFCQFSFRQGDRCYCLLARLDSMAKIKKNANISICCVTFKHTTFQSI
jgi:hypothetical protein